MSETGAITASMVGTDAWVVPQGDLDITNIAKFESALPTQPSAANATSLSNSPT